MEIIEVSPDVREVYAAEIPELVWSTGPVSYEYQFGTREIFDHAVRGSWPMDGTLFGADATALAIEDGALMGIEIGMRGYRVQNPPARAGTNMEKPDRTGRCFETRLLRIAGTS